MTARGHVRAMVGPDDVRWIGIRYADRYLIKRLRRADRWWSRTLHCWITPTHVIDDVRDWLEEEGYTVGLVDVRNVPTRVMHPAATTPTPETTR